MRAATYCFLLSLVLAAGGCGPASTGTDADQNARAAANAASTTPATEANKAVQRVAIDSPDGLRLIGSFYAPAKAGSPAVLLLHQWESTRHPYDAFAERMAAKGFAVLSIDGRGFGESTKKADGTTVAAGRSDADVKAMIGDVDAAFNFLSKQTNVDPKRVSIVGASYGSSLAIIYAADHPGVATVGLLSPGLNYFGNMPTEPAIKKSGDRHVLLVAANDDKESADAVNKLRAVAGSDHVEAKVYDSGGHGTALLNAKVGLDELLEQFLTKNL